MFATIYLPNFYLQAAIRHQPELRLQPVALLDDQETKAVIIQLNQIAENAGVNNGMTPSQGLARCLNLVVRTRMRGQEQLLGEMVLLAPWRRMSKPLRTAFVRSNLPMTGILLRRSRV